MPQTGEGLSQSKNSGVRDVASREVETMQVGEALSQMVQAAVIDSVAEANV